jgi:hypothetical protein
LKTASSSAVGAWPATYERDASAALRGLVAAAEEERSRRSGAPTLWGAAAELGLLGGSDASARELVAALDGLAAGEESLDESRAALAAALAPAGEALSSAAIDLGGAAAAFAPRFAAISSAAACASGSDNSRAHSSAAARFLFFFSDATSWLRS